MQDREAQFLDALYLGVRDRAEFDQALDLLSALFDVASAALIDFDAARPDVSAQATVGLFAGEAVERYQRDFAAIDPAPPAFMTQPAGTAISTYRLHPRRGEGRACSSASSSGRSASKSASAGRLPRPMAASP